VSSIRSTPRHEGNEATGQRANASTPERGSEVRRSAGTRQRARRWLPLSLVLGALVIVTSGCTSNDFTRMGLAAPVTKQGQVTLAMWQGSWVAAWAVGIVVWGGILWTIFFHRKRGNGQPLPQQVRYNLPIEIMYTVLPFIMVGVLFYFTARDENYIDKLPAHPQVVVNVTGFQWSWEFQYPQYKLSNTNSGESMVTETGTMWNPTPGAVQHLPVLVIPEHETVQFNLTSIDVIHSFDVTSFDFKRDVVPGFANHFAITAVKTGTFIGRCSELCGVYHSRMLFRLKIVTPAQFQAWVHRQQVHENSGGIQ
jgi:cytochrome c oxidase subunit II